MHTAFTKAVALNSMVIPPQIYNYGFTPLCVHQTQAASGVRQTIANNMGIYQGVLLRNTRGNYTPYFLVVISYSMVNAKQALKKINLSYSVFTHRLSDCFRHNGEVQCHPASIKLLICSD